MMSGDFWTMRCLVAREHIRAIADNDQIDLLTAYQQLRNICDRMDMDIAGSIRCYKMMRSNRTEK